MKLIPNWRVELNKLWSIRAALFMTLVGVADQILGAFMDHLPPVVYSVLAVLIGVARLADQQVGTGDSDDDYT